MDAVLEHVSQKIYTQIGTKDFEELVKFLHQNEYDSDALIQDLKTVIFDENQSVEYNEKISNIFHICMDENCIIHIKDHIRYYHCMY